MRTLARLVQEEGQRWDEVEEPGGCLENRRGGREIEYALEERSVPRGGWNGLRNIKGQVVQPGQETGFLQVVHAVRQNARRNNDQESAGPGEEAAQIDLERTAVDQVAEDDRDQQPKSGTQQWGGSRTRALGSSLGSRPEEQCRFQALTAHRQ